MSPLTNVQMELRLRILIRALTEGGAAAMRKELEEIINEVAEEVRDDARFEARMRERV